MTWIISDSGTRWVEPTPRKRRKSARALRFADIKVGDQLQKAWIEKSWIMGTDNQMLPAKERSRTVAHYIVTDLWFDPVAGQRDAVAGEMVAIRRVDHRGEVVGHKEPHTKRGLASQGFHYADRDYIAFVKARAEAENVVGIGMGSIIRRRPKQPGHHI